MVRPTMMKTITVVSHVSFQLGQVTLLISRRTSWKNCSGETRRRGADDASASVSTSVLFVRSAISNLLFKLDRGGGTRSHGPLLWRPKLYQQNNTPRNTRRGRRWYASHVLTSRFSRQRRRRRYGRLRGWRSAASLPSRSARSARLPPRYYRLASPSPYPPAACRCPSRRWCGNRIAGGSWR